MVMKDGKIEAVGSHDQLLRDHPNCFYSRNFKERAAKWHSKG